MTNTAYAQGTTEQIIDTLLAALKPDTTTALVVFFAHKSVDGQKVGDALRERFPSASVIGCSSNGVFSDQGYSPTAAVALSIPQQVAPRCSAVLAKLSSGASVDEVIERAGAQLEQQLGTPLRSLSHDHHVGLCLLEGATAREENINEALGNIAPALRFVGGSAGDDITFSGTWVYCNGECTPDGCALVVLEMACPFEIIHACHFEPTDQQVTITEVAEGTRFVRQIDNKPAAQFYSQLAEKPATELQFGDFLGRPLGLMIDDMPWLRSPVRTEGDAVLFACRMLPGAKLNIMKPHEILTDTKEKLSLLQQNLGGRPSAMILFNCAYRMIEAQITKNEESLHQAFSVSPHIGLHTNGESYLGHINQTLVGLAWRQE